MADATKEAKQVKDRAGEHGQEVAHHAAEQANAVKETAKEQASVVAGQALDHGRSVIADLRSEFEDHGDQQAGRASEALRGISSELDQMLGSSGGQGPAHDVAREAADRAGSLASRLDQDGVNGVLEDVQRFARRRPGRFLLAAAGTGFAVGRLMRNTDLNRLKEAATGDGASQSPSLGGAEPSNSAPGGQPAVGATALPLEGDVRNGNPEQGDPLAAGAPLRGGPSTVNP